jgi:hypothetical protein
VATPPPEPEPAAAAVGTIAAPKDSKVLRHRTKASIRFIANFIIFPPYLFRLCAAKYGAFPLEIATPFTIQSIIFHYTFSHYAEQPLK